MAWVDGWVHTTLSFMKCCMNLKEMGLILHLSCEMLYGVGGWVGSYNIFFHKMLYEPKGGHYCIYCSMDLGVMEVLFLLGIPYFFKK